MRLHEMSAGRGKPARLAGAALLGLMLLEGATACADGEDQADPSLVEDVSESGGVLLLEEGQACPLGGGDFSAGANTAQNSAEDVTIKIEKWYTSVDPFVLCGPTETEEGFDGVNALMAQTGDINYSLGAAAG